MNHPSVTPSTPAPGENATLSAVLRNAGDLTVNSLQVAFYDDGDQIGSTQTLPDLMAGYTTTVQVGWTVPVTATAHTLKAVADPNAQVTETDETNNEYIRETTLPDLTIDVLYTTHASDALSITTRLTNAGAIDATSFFTLALRTGDPITGTLVTTATVDSGVAAGGAVTVTRTITDAASVAGLGDTLWVVADAGDAVAEHDEANNTAATALNVLPDLTLTAGDIHDGEPLTVTLYNTGFVTATDVTIGVRDGGITGTLLYSDTLPAIPAGEAGVITPTVSASDHTLYVWADPDNVIAELDESNNLAVRAVTLPPRRLYLPLVLRE